MLADCASSELLCAIVRRPDDAAAQRVDRLAENVRDWDSLLNLAREHRVLPMLFSQLADMGPAVPRAVEEQLRAEYHRNIFHNMSNAAELIALLKAFDRHAIPVIPLKGVVLGASIYGTLNARPAGDLDLLIHHRDLARAMAVLLERGCKLKTPLRADGTPVYPNTYEYSFERPMDGMVIEIRWRLTEPRFGSNLGMDWVWPLRRTAMLAGAEVPNLSPEITLLMLCMHGSKHTWSRLIWICDIAQLLASSPGLDWNEVNQTAKRFGLWRTLALGVVMGHRVAGAAVPPAILRPFESDATVRRLARHIQETLFDAPGSLPQGRMPYAFQLLGFRDRVRWFLSLDFLRPKESDRSALQLPPSLDALYYLVRPVRMLWDKSARP